MRAWASATVAGVLLALSTGASAQQVSLTLDDGYVTLTAKDATVRQILAEWSRVGQTHIVNADRIADAPVTLQLIKVPEAEALDVLLRSVSGYMAAPRAAAQPNASRFDRILVMPTSTPPRVSAAPQAAQIFQAPPALPDDFDTVDPADQPVGGPPPGRSPVFPQFPGGPGQVPLPPGFGQRGPAAAPQQQQDNSFPQAMPFPQPVTPAQGFTPPPAMPGGLPVGVSTPGMMVAPPQPIPNGSPNDPPQ